MDKSKPPKITYAEFKQKVFNIIDPFGTGKASKVFDICIIVLILVNVALVITDSFDVLESFRVGFEVIEWITVIIFTAEYVLRV